MPHARNDNNGPAKVERWFGAALVFLCFAAVISIFSKTRTCSLWEHLNVGRQILIHGSLPSTDPWSYLTAGQQWLSYNWMFEALLGEVYSVFHQQLIALTLLKMTLVLVLVGLLIWHLFRCKLSPFLVAFLLIPALMVMGSFLFELRPHLLTAIFFSLMLMAINEANNGGRRWMYAMPPLLLLWCNCHGGFVAGLLVMAVWCAADFLDASRLKRAIDWHRLGANLLLLSVCLAAVFVNPFGSRLPLTIFESLQLPRYEFADWRPISLFTLSGLLYVIWLAVSAFALLKSRLTKTLPMLAVFAVIALTPFSASRNLLLFMLSCLVLAGPHIQDTLQNLFNFDGKLSTMSARTKVLMATGAFIAGVVLMADAPSQLQAIVCTSPLPTRAVALLQAAHATGNLATSFDWGDYCIWHLNPDMKVSSDGRREAVYSNDALQTNLRFALGTHDWDGVLTRYKTDAVLIPRNYSAFALLARRTDWQLCYEDNVCGIFAPRDSKLAHQLSQTQVPALKEFTFP
jgi:hypothetical protein